MTRTCGRNTSAWWWWGATEKCRSFFEEGKREKRETQPHVVSCWKEQSSKYSTTLLPTTPCTCATTDAKMGVVKLNVLIEQRCWRSSLNGVTGSRASNRFILEEKSLFYRSVFLLFYCRNAPRLQMFGTKVHPQKCNFSSSRIVVERKRWQHKKWQCTVSLFEEEEDGKKKNEVGGRGRGVWYINRASNFVWRWNQQPTHTNPLRANWRGTNNGKKKHFTSANVYVLTILNEIMI